MMYDIAEKEMREYFKKLFDSHDLAIMRFAETLQNAEKNKAEKRELADETNSIQAIMEHAHSINEYLEARRNYYTKLYQDQVARDIFNKFNEFFGDQNVPKM